MASDGSDSRRLFVSVTDGAGRPRAAGGLAAWLASAAPRTARGAVAIALVDDRTIRGLNRKYRRKNYATDVLGTASAGLVISAKGHLFSFWGGHRIAGVINVGDDGANLDDYGPAVAAAWRSELAHIYDEESVHAVLRDHDTLISP